MTFGLLSMVFILNRLRLIKHTLMFITIVIKKNSDACQFGAHLYADCVGNRAIVSNNIRKYCESSFVAKYNFFVGKNTVIGSLYKNS